MVDNTFQALTAHILYILEHNINKFYPWIYCIFFDYIATCNIHSHFNQITLEEALPIKRFLEFMCGFSKMM